MIAKSGMALLALTTIAGMGQALAADLPAKAYQPPAPVIVPVYNWTGFYIGGNLGGEWTNARLLEFSTGASWGANRANFIGGGQLGYNYQFSNNVVLGIEWTFDWGGSGNKSAVVPTAVGNLQASANGAKWLTTLTGRLGYAFDRTLVYMKGGGAWVDSSTSLVNLSTAAGVTVDKWVTGWTIGGGVEYAFLPNWTVKAEYNYISTGAWTSSAAPAVPAGQVKLSGYVQTFTTGVNFKF